jgi:uncharacterized circularly permuted ATP-grasp superfamily protein
MPDESELFGRYRLAAYDEMFESPGQPRPHYRPLYERLLKLGPEELERRHRVADLTMRQQGITFTVYGREQGVERIIPFDPIPRLIDAAEWQVIERGLDQRVRALNLFIRDVYHDRRILKDRVVPAELVFGASGYRRQCVGLRVPRDVYIHVSGIDLIRDADGRFLVLEDNCRTPSGVSYVLKNRQVMKEVFPLLFERYNVRPVDDYTDNLLAVLRSIAPAACDDPFVVVLSPGIYNSAYYEHSFLARQMGVELVEGRDLVCRNEVVYMRTTEGEQRVDVVYRRVDDDFLDPVHFRPDSFVGCPGILNAARAGNVTIANAVGNGVADDKLAYTYVPEMIRYYLGEEPILPNVHTYRLEDPDQLAYVLGRMDRLVLKPVSGSGGYGIIIGYQASDEDLAVAREALLANPRDWIAQEVVPLSTAPTSVGDHLAPRHLDLRPFAVNDGEKIWVVPGGLTRVALPEGGLVVNSSQGGGSKDTWIVVGDRPADAPPPQPAAAANGTRHKRAPGTVGTVARPDQGPSSDPEIHRQQAEQQQQSQSPSSGGRAAGC